MRRSTACSLIAGSLTVKASSAPIAALAQSVLRMGVIPIDADAEPYYANEIGAFRKRGLSVDILTISNGAAILAAVVGGSLDLGATAAISLVAAYKRGVPVTCVAPTSYYTSRVPSTVLMVAQDSPIKTARDLAGKSVGVNALKDLTQLATMAWVDKSGGVSSDVKFIELGFAHLLAALQQKRVDAAVITEPFISNAKQSARVLGNPYDAVASEFPVGCFFVKSDFAKDNGRQLGQVIDALHDAGLWANAHQRESASILAKASDTDLAVIQATTRVTYPRRRLMPADVQPLIDLAAKYGLIPATFPAQEIVWTGN
jgi:NitT/TauT family transport system substrate-binding protein